MKKNVFRSFFQAWCSAQSVLLFLFVVYLVVLAVRSFNLGAGEMAGWVQAFGAIISIWAAWWIASQQSKRSEEAKGRADLAKSIAVLGLLEHVLRVVRHEAPDNQKRISGRDVRDSLDKVLAMLDRVDLLSLPDPALVTLVLDVRHAVEIFEFKVRNRLKPDRDTLFSLHHYCGFSLACKIEISSKIAICEEVVKSLS